MVQNGLKWSKMVKNGQKMVKMVNKSEYFLIGIFWITRAPPPLLTESKKKTVFYAPLTHWIWPLLALNTQANCSKQAVNNLGFSLLLLQPPPTQGRVSDNSRNRKSEKSFFPQVQLSDSYPPISLSLVKTYWCPVGQLKRSRWSDWWNQEYENIGMA